MSTCLDSWCSAAVFFGTDTYSIFGTSTPCKLEICTRPFYGISFASCMTAYLELKRGFGTWVNLRQFSTNTAVHYQCLEYNPPHFVYELLENMHRSFLVQKCSPCPDFLQNTDLTILATAWKKHQHSISKGHFSLISSIPCLWHSVACGHIFSWTAKCNESMKRRPACPYLKELWVTKKAFCLHWHHRHLAQLFQHLSCNIKSILIIEKQAWAVPSQVFVWFLFNYLIYKVLVQTHSIFTFFLFSKGLNSNFPQWVVNLAQHRRQ